jgi:hypothetical protein
MPILNYTHVAANGTTVIQAAQPVVLAVVTINTRGTSPNILTLYDGPDASSPVIAVIDTSVSVGTLLYEVNTNIGLTAVLAGGAAADVTIGWG